MRRRSTHARTRGGLPAALAAARHVLHSPDAAEQVTQVVRGLLADDPMHREAQADVARRLSQSPEGLARLRRHASAILDAAVHLLDPQHDEDWRIRGHMLLLAARVAGNRPQQQRCFAIVMEYVHADRTALRANALEALATLASRNPQFRETVEPLLLLRSLRTATAAEKIRARDGLRLLGVEIPER